MGKHVWQHLQEQHHLQTLLVTASSVYGLAKGGRFEDSEKAGEPICAIQPQTLAELCATEHGT